MARIPKVKSDTDYLNTELEAVLVAAQIRSGKSSAEVAKDAGLSEGVYVKKRAGKKAVFNLPELRAVVKSVKLEDDDILAFIRRVKK